MPQRELDNYGYRDGGEDRISRGDAASNADKGLNNQDAKKNAGQLSANYVGLKNVEIPTLIKAVEKLTKQLQKHILKGSVETSTNFSSGVIYDGEKTATKVCVEISGMFSTKPQLEAEFVKIQEMIKKVLDPLSMIDTRKTDEAAANNISIEIKVGGEANTFTSKAIEGSVKVSTAKGVQWDWKPGITVTEMIGIGLKISVEGCMTIKNEQGAVYSNTMMDYYRF